MRVEEIRSNSTWEEAVDWLRSEPGQAELVRACYFDDPLSEAAARFAGSEEWSAVRQFLPPVPGRALDLGAGRGISSFALASAGWQVTALEPDPSLLVGTGAIRALAQETGLDIEVVENYGENLPFENNTFNLVYMRQVLHHARDLPLLCQEAARVLRPGGRFIATREHVISQPKDLQTFLNDHPLHRFYGGEHAYLLQEYTSAIRQSGLLSRNILGPVESVINYFPMTGQQRIDFCRNTLSRTLGYRIATVLTSLATLSGKWLLDLLARRVDQADNRPGRMYSFIAEKPWQ